jgi:hypothetical protein
MSRHAPYHTKDHGTRASKPPTMRGFGHSSMSYEEYQGSSQIVNAQTLQLTSGVPLYGVCPSTSKLAPAATSTRTACRQYDVAVQTAEPCYSMWPHHVAVQLAVQACYRSAAFWVVPASSNQHPHSLQAVRRGSTYGSTSSLNHAQQTAFAPCSAGPVLKFTCTSCTSAAAEAMHELIQLLCIFSWPRTCQVQWAHPPCAKACVLYPYSLCGAGSKFQQLLHQLHFLCCYSVVQCSPARTTWFGVQLQPFDGRQLIYSSFLQDQTQCTATCLGDLQSCVTLVYTCACAAEPNTQCHCVVTAKLPASRVWYPANGRCCMSEPL